MPDVLRSLIEEYLARVRDAVALFRVHRGLDAPDVMCWRRHGLPQTGWIDEAGTVPYFFHGIGCCVHLPSGSVDWDFGVDGRVDGFSPWKLAQFAESRGGQYEGLTDWRVVRSHLEKAEEAGVVGRPYLAEQDDLYSLLADGREPSGRRRGDPSPVLWLLLHVLAGALFLVGLLAPLPPSEGRPTPLDAGLFAGVPLALWLGSVALTRDRGRRVFSVLMLLVAAAVIAWLYTIQAGGAVRG